MSLKKIVFATQALRLEFRSSASAQVISGGYTITAVQRGGSLELTGQPGLPVIKFQVQLRDPVSKNKVESN